MNQLPPEWAPQQAILFTWPHAHSDWVSRLDAIDRVYVDMVAAVSRFQHAIISCFDHEHQQHIHKLLQQAKVDSSRVASYIVPSNDTWVRDHGPLTVFHNGQRHLLDFTFNGWGEKYPSELDNQLTRGLYRLGAFKGFAIETPGLVLEGGSIEVDGQGSLLTTRECLLSPRRNPGLSQEQIEQHLQQYFGIQQVLWLDHGHLEGDDTDGHIDTLARFCDPHTITYVQCSDASDSHYSELQAMEAELKQLKNTQGQSYRLVPLPMPAPIHDEDGARLPATYANFLIINGAVLMPTYRDAADSLAIAQLKSCFPEREILPIDALPLVHQYGSIHCATMQLPR